MSNIIQETKLDVVLRAALRKRDVELSELFTMSQADIDALPVPGTLRNHVASYVRRYGKRSEIAIEAKIDAVLNAGVAETHNEVPEYEPKVEMAKIAEDYQAPQEAKELEVVQPVVETAEVDVVAYSEDELREVVAKVDGKTYKTILKNAVDVLETAAIDDALLIKVVKARVAELKAQK